jgi:hypothetical protein
MSDLALVSELLHQIRHAAQLISKRFAPNFWPL